MGLHSNPSFETTLSGWESNTNLGSKIGGSVTTRAAAQAHAGSWSCRAQWAVMSGTQATWVDTPLAGHIVGRRYRLQSWIYIPSGSLDTRLEVAFNGNGAWITERDQWVFTTLDYTATQATHHVGFAPKGPGGGPGIYAYADEFDTDLVPNNVATLSGTVFKPSFLELNNHANFEASATPLVRSQWAGISSVTSPRKIYVDGEWRPLFRQKWPGQ